MLSQPASTSPISYTIDQIAASVAPPMLINLTSSPSHCRIRPGRLTGIQSPLSITTRNGTSTPRPPAYSTSISISAGTEFHTVTCSFVSSSAQCAGSRMLPLRGSTSVPPAPSVPNTSYTDKSKLNDDSPNTRSSAWIPIRWFTSTIVFSVASCVIITPFGCPVEPDV